jgi:hypothetical protein
MRERAPLCSTLNLKVGAAAEEVCWSTDRREGISTDEVSIARRLRTNVVI